eukprot:6040141-Pyramimonas_sp.AAC.1
MYCTVCVVSLATLLAAARKTGYREDGTGEEGQRLCSPPIPSSIDRWPAFSSQPRGSVPAASAATPPLACSSSMPRRCPRTPWPLTARCPP